MSSISRKGARGGSDAIARHTSLSITPMSDRMSGDGSSPADCAEKVLLGAKVRVHAPTRAARTKTDDRVRDGDLHLGRHDRGQSFGQKQGRAAARPDPGSVVPGCAPESDLVSIVIAIRHLANAVRVRLALGRLQTA